VRRLEAKQLDLGGSDRARTVGRTEVIVVSLGGTTITREVAQPGWPWSEDVKPVVGTELCRAGHQIYVVSGRMHVVMDNAELEVGAGDAVVIPPAMTPGWSARSPASSWTSRPRTAISSSPARRTTR